MKNGLVVTESGCKRWYLNDVLHRIGGPAMERVDGTKLWFLNGVRHRVDGAAVEWANGSRTWWLHDRRHRIEGPAVVWANGVTLWFLYGSQIIHPEEFSTMEEWIEYLNDNEEETYKLIHDRNGFISFIDNPSAKQTRVHQMAHLL